MTLIPVFSVLSTDIKYPWISLDVVESILSLSRNREYDNTERISAGFNEEIDILKAFEEAWADFARYKILPPL